MPVVSRKRARIMLTSGIASLATYVVLGASPACIAQGLGAPDAANQHPDASAGGAAAAHTNTASSPTVDIQARDWAYACATCHGIGRSAVKDIPTLAGMPAQDIVKAMQAYAHDQTPGVLKGQLARGYDDAVLLRIGKWYESQPRQKAGQP